MEQKPVKWSLGEIVHDPSGAAWTVGAIVFSGERYYMMTDKRGVVSFMPAVEVDTWRPGR